ncbi:MAG: hypothetical protein Q4D16_09050 [Eubacteriales bacterium]|nr:hypothetical protein [Eubacteriales bacterium]
MTIWEAGSLERHSGNTGGTVETRRKEINKEIRGIQYEKVRKMVNMFIGSFDDNVRAGGGNGCFRWESHESSYGHPAD